MSNDRQRMIHFSCFIIQDRDAWNEIYMPFRRGRCEDIEGSRGATRGHPNASLTAKHKHTNLARGGRSGLPKDWELDVERITVFADRQSGPVLDNVRFAFSYDLRTVATWKGMDELVPGHDLPVSMRENTPFWVEALVPCGWDVGDRTKEHKASDGEPSDPYPAMYAVVDRVWPKGGTTDFIHAHCLHALGDLQGHHTEPGQTMVWIVLEGHGQVVVV